MQKLGFKCCYFVFSLSVLEGSCVVFHNANFCLYSSHTQGEQLPPPQHSSELGRSGLVIIAFGVGCMLNRL